MTAPSPAPIGLQLYTLRRQASKNLAGVLERIAAIGYTGVEIAGLHRMRADEFRRRIDELGLELIGSFVAVEGNSEWGSLLDEQSDLGTDVLVTGFPREQCASTDALARAADVLNEFADVARGRGMTVGYHNHWWEFTPRPDGRLPMTELLDRLERHVFFEVDIYWLQTAGLDPAAALPQFGSRARRLHVKDGPCMRGEPQTAVGVGKMDIPAALAAAPEAEWHVVEIDDVAGDVFAAVDASYRYLTGHRLSKGSERAPT